MDLNIEVNNCRWLLDTKSNGIITENHGRGVTWKKVYKEEYGQMKGLCLQILSTSTIIHAKESPFGEYWTMEEALAAVGSSIPVKWARYICSLQHVDPVTKIGVWDVKSINRRGEVGNHIMSDVDIGYEVRNYINPNEIRS